MFTVGLSKRTTSEGLREAFSKFGEIVQGIIRSFHIYKHVKLNKQLRLFLVNEFAYIQLGWLPIAFRGILRGLAL